MLTIAQIKENPQYIIERLGVKGFDGNEAIANVLELDGNRRQLQLNNDNQAAELNKYAATIGKLMKEGKKDAADIVEDAVEVAETAVEETVDAVEDVVEDVKAE